MQNIEQAVEFINAYHKQGETVWLRNGSYGIAYLNPLSNCETITDANWSRYFDEEARMSNSEIKRKGYISLFLIAANGAGVKHMRVTYDNATGQFEAHYLD